jgi:hypothetical protein
MGPLQYERRKQEVNSNEGRSIDVQNFLIPLK